MLPPQSKACLRHQAFPTLCLQGETEDHRNHLLLMPSLGENKYTETEGRKEERLRKTGLGTEGQTDSEVFCFVSQTLRSTSSSSREERVGLLDNRPPRFNSVSSQTEGPKGQQQGLD